MILFSREGLKQFLIVRINPQMNMQEIIEWSLAFVVAYSIFLFILLVVMRLLFGGKSVG